MKRPLAVALFALALCLTVADGLQAARVRVKRGPRGHVTKVTVRPGFPIRRALPNVVVRPGPVVRVAPRVYLAPAVFGAVVIASLPDADRQVWHESVELDREDSWTDFTMNVDRRGDRMFLDISGGSAQISFAEVVFENGEAQVVDFNDHVHARGIYSLIDFKDGRKVDHVRIVAKADSPDAQISLHLTT